MYSHIHGLSSIWILIQFDDIHWRMTAVNILRNLLIRWSVQLNTIQFELFKPFAIHSQLNTTSV